MRSGWLFLLASLSACAAQEGAALDRARMLSGKGQDEAAITVLREHLVEHPDALEERRLLVRLLASAGDLGAARAEVDVLRRHLGPDSPVPWIELGHAFELSHRYEAALQMFDRAAEVAPKNPAGPLTGGLRAARWGEPEWAAPRLEEALRRDPKNSEAWHALGLVRFHLGSVKQAIDAYRAGLEANPADMSNRVGLATVALAADDLVGALEQYDAILEARPGFADAHLGRSLVLIKTGKLREARESLERGYRLGANPEVVGRQRELLDRLEGPPTQQSKPERIR
jgi:tetratricopeptide (TPR) repeat protein